MSQTKKYVIGFLCGLGIWSVVSESEAATTRRYYQRSLPPRPHGPAPAAAAGPINPPAVPLSPSAELRADMEALALQERKEFRRLEP